MADLPEYVGLCPVHVKEFYMPLDRLTEDSSLTCPECNQEMAVYVRIHYYGEGEAQQLAEVITLHQTPYVRADVS